MSLETEIKLRVDSHDTVRDRLRAVGARFLGRVLEWNVILDSADARLRASGCGLRLRTSTPMGEGPPRACLTFKGPRRPGPVKQREEQEVEVGSADQAEELLRSLGLVAVLRYEKQRESWTLHTCKVELDTPPKLGLFVEIEGPDEAGLRAVQRELQLDDVPLEAASYVSLLMEYCNAAGISDRTLRLD